MQMHRLGRAAIFLAAFIIVFVHPQLLQRPQAPPPEAATPTPAQPGVAENPVVGARVEGSSGAERAGASTGTGEPAAEPSAPATGARDSTGLAAESYAAA